MAFADCLMVCNSCIGLVLLLICHPSITQVRLRILLNGEDVDALSSLQHHSTAISRGRTLVHEIKKVGEVSFKSVDSEIKTQHAIIHALDVGR